MAKHYLDQISYTRGDKIGSGAFGDVYKAYEDTSNKIFALKDIKCTNNNELDDVVREIKALGMLSHQNIIILFNVKAKQMKSFEATFSLLLEYCPGGDLNERFSRDSSQSLNLRWMSEIADAVEYLHGKNIIHRDLKPHNILLTDHDNLKIADFGLAKRFARREQNQSWLDYYIEVGVGAACFVAPEMLTQHYTYKADIFSIGIVFYAIVERSFIIVGGKKCYGAFVPDETGEKSPLGIEMFNKKKDIDVAFTRENATTKLIQKTLKYDYNARPTAEEIKLALPKNNRCLLL